jgi:SAM-dependent methyltransferase
MSEEGNWFGRLVRRIKHNHYYHNYSARNYAKFWDNRYAMGGSSGPGSEGILAAEKAAFINQYVKKKRIQYVFELGCGDGQQLARATYGSYIGLDISPRAVHLCRTRFADDESKIFFHCPPEEMPFAGPKLGDLGLSLDVLYHLPTEDDLRSYLTTLFGAARKHVIIFAHDGSTQVGFNVPALPWQHLVADLAPGWKRTAEFKTAHHKPDRPTAETTIAQFFVYEAKKVAA